MQSGHVSAKASRYSWLVFSLSFGLLISDYMSRQVLNAVFPLLKLEWSISDAQLGALSGVVALMVGLLTVPLSMMADRFGRARSLVLMAVLWSLATLAGAWANSYTDMLVARFFVGIGEAAYGSVGIALVLSLFPQRLRGGLTAAFMAGGMVGTVLGLGLGGYVASSWGWRAAFALMAAIGLLLALVFKLLVKEPPTNAPAFDFTVRNALSAATGKTSTKWLYLGSGLQIFVSAAMMAWLPSYFYRYYSFGIDKNAFIAAGIVGLGAAGMILCGVISDRFSGRLRGGRRLLAITYTACSAVFLGLAFQIPPSVFQIALLALGMFFAGGVTGPVGAMIAGMVTPAVHGTAFAVLTLSNNLIGLAPGPFVIGLLADAWSLSLALGVLPVVSLLSVVCLFKVSES